MPIDISGLDYFSTVFVFVFVWLVVYALLAYSNAVGSNKTIHAILGFLVAIFVVLSNLATGVIKYISPWFGVIFVFIIFITIMFQLFKPTGFELQTFAPMKIIFFVLIVIVILIGALNYVRENSNIAKEQKQVDKEGVDYTKTSNVLLHPKMVGALFLLLIAVFTVALLVEKHK